MPGHVRVRPYYVTGKPTLGEMNSVEWQVKPYVFRWQNDGVHVLPPKIRGAAPRALIGAGSTNRNECAIPRGLQ